MNILVLGANGMAGHLISKYLIEKNHNVTTLTRRKFNIGKNINLDVTNFEKLKDVIIKNEFDAIINCVGILNEAAENNKANAVLINSYLPHFLTKVTRKSKTKVIHLSTDCVFSGEDGSYNEDSLRDGASFYDRSKALGELNNNKDLTFRNSLIGPDIDENGIGLFNWFMKQNKEINGYSKAIWTGVTTLTLAKAIERALTEDLKGLHHLVNNETISKYQLLKLFNEYFKNNNIIINKDASVKVNKSLVNNRNDFDFEVPSYERMVKEMKEWIIDHKKLYPHYNIKE